MYQKVECKQGRIKTPDDFKFLARKVYFCFDFKVADLTHIHIHVNKAHPYVNGCKWVYQEALYIKQGFKVASRVLKIEVFKKD